MSNNLFEKRQSVRSFLPDEIPQEAIDRLLAAAADAPSGGNCQPWHFYVVKSAHLREQLSAAAYGQRFLAEAPLVIVVCTEPERSADRYFDRGRDLYCIQDTAAAIENILLCATLEGLGSCWCGAFDEEQVRNVLSISFARRPVAMLAIGYSKKLTDKPKRRPMAEITTILD